MYKNIGQKIMVLSKIVTWLIIIGGVVTGIVFLSEGHDEMILIGIGIIVASPLVAYLSTVVLYGFGKLVDSAEKIKRKMYDYGELKSDAQLKADQKRIDKLEELRSQGLITEEEYKTAVAKTSQEV